MQHSVKILFVAAVCFSLLCVSGFADDKTFSFQDEQGYVPGDAYAQPGNANDYDNWRYEGNYPAKGTIVPTEVFVRNAWEWEGDIDPTSLTPAWGVKADGSYDQSFDPTTLANNGQVRYFEGTQQIYTGQSLFDAPVVTVDVRWKAVDDVATNNHIWLPIETGEEQIDTETVQYTISPLFFHLTRQQALDELGNPIIETDEMGMPVLDGDGNPIPVYDQTLLIRNVQGWWSAVEIATIEDLPDTFLTMNITVDTATDSFTVLIEDEEYGPYSYVRFDPPVNNGLSNDQRCMINGAVDYVFVREYDKYATPADATAKNHVNHVRWDADGGIEGTGLYLSGDAEFNGDITNGMWNGGQQLKTDTLMNSDIVTVDVSWRSMTSNMWESHIWMPVGSQPDYVVDGIQRFSPLFFFLTRVDNGDGTFSQQLQIDDVQWFWGAVTLDTITGLPDALLDMSIYVDNRRQSFTVTIDGVEYGPYHYARADAGGGTDFCLAIGGNSESTNLLQLDYVELNEYDFPNNNALAVNLQNKGNLGVLHGVHSPTVEQPAAKPGALTADAAGNMPIHNTFVWEGWINLLPDHPNGYPFGTSISPTGEENQENFRMFIASSHGNEGRTSYLMFKNDENNQPKAYVLGYPPIGVADAAADVTYYPIDLGSISWAQWFKVRVEIDFKDMMDINHPDEMTVTVYDEEGNLVSETPGLPTLEGLYMSGLAWGFDAGEVAPANSIYVNFVSPWTYEPDCNPPNDTEMNFMLIDDLKIATYTEIDIDLGLADAPSGSAQVPVTFSAYDDIGALCTEWSENVTCQNGRASMTVQFDDLPFPIASMEAVTATETIQEDVVNRQVELSTIAGLPIEGDANMDCKVNIIDLIFVRNRLNADVASDDNWQADVNGDGKVNIIDLIYVRNRLNTKCE